MYCFAKSGALQFAGAPFATTIMVVTVIIISWMSYISIEMPARIWVKRQMTMIVAAKSKGEALLAMTIAAPERAENPISANGDH
jgi:peptidoglycan/LPS O-acetylase OafA/YrhL